MSLGQIIDYFRDELRKKLERPNCQRTLTLWDQVNWLKSNNAHPHFLINTNDFLQFWYRTCHELCCVNDNRAIILRNALDKYFYFLLDFENYFSIFIERKTFTSREDIMTAVIEYNLDKKKLKSKLKRNIQLQDLFKEFVNRVNEWNYWKKVIIVEFIKINIGEEAYESSKRTSLDGLTKLLHNTEILWDRGLQGGIQEDSICS